MIKRNYLFGLVAAAAAFFISAYGSHAHTTVHGVAPDGVWTWVDGSTLIDQPGVYGTQGVPDAANVPGARRGAASWTDESGRLWLFGGGGFNGAGTSGLLNDLWRFDPDTGLWTWLGGSDGINQPGVYGTEDMPSMGSWPGARSGAASWIDESGNLWLFGGLGFDENGDEGALNDLWRYDPVTGVWTWADGSTIIDQAGVYGTEDVPAAANVPGARAPAGSWFNTDGYLWLFGGSGLDSMGQFGFLNDLWRFDIASDQWTWVDGSTVDDQAGVYGTEDVPAAANVPGARSGAASWPDATDGLWLFGGFGSDSTGPAGRMNDLWHFDIPSGQWTWVDGSTVSFQPGVYGTEDVPAAANVPGARTGAAAWQDHDGDLWAFGGFGYDSTGSLVLLSDLWRFDPDTGQWAWVDGETTGDQTGSYGTEDVPNPGNLPGGRDNAVHWWDDAGALWVFGELGLDSTGSLGSLNDLWRFSSVVLNAGFEGELSGPWASLGGEDRFKTGQAYAGDYVMLFQGSGTQELIRQVIPLAGPSGDSYTLGFQIGGRNIPNEGAVGARIEFLAGGGVVNHVDCLVPNRGTFTWQAITCPTATAAGPYDAVRINIGWRGVSSGQLGIDAVDLTNIP